MKRFITLFTCFYSLVSVQAQQYQPVNDKSSVNFTIKNFGISTGGSFKGLEGQINFDMANPVQAVFDITLDAASVSTDNDSRDSHLRNEEYFDTRKYPKISFKSEKVNARGNGFLAKGNLTIKGTTKSISLPFKVQARDDGYLFEGSFQLDRRDFKIGNNSMVLGDDVTVTLSVFARKK
ncbi:MAG: YceI family protein [Bacteroidota bacterium]